MPWRFTKMILLLNGIKSLDNIMCSKMTEHITKVWFDDKHIIIATDAGAERCLPLECFPCLFYANSQQREHFYLWDDNRSIRWEELDEDIHISNFYENVTVNYDNEVNRLLSRFPYLNLKGIAEVIGLHWTLLARLRFGIVKPTAEIMQRIRNGLAAISRELATV